MMSAEPEVVGRGEELAAIERFLESPVERTLVFEGPAGIRSDNGEFDVQLWGVAPSGPKGKNGT